MARVKKLKVGHGLAEGTIVGPLHSSSQRDEIESQVQDAVDRGARVLTGGSRMRGGDFDSGHFFAPTLLADVPEDARVASEEVFGPALPIFRVGSFDEAIEKRTILSSDWIFDLDQHLNRATRAAERIEAGDIRGSTRRNHLDELPLEASNEARLARAWHEALDYYTRRVGCGKSRSQPRAGGKP